MEPTTEADDEHSQLAANAARRAPGGVRKDSVGAKSASVRGDDSLTQLRFVVSRRAKRTRARTD
jgi:hypothetical protein